MKAKIFIGLIIFAVLISICLVLGFMVGLPLALSILYSPYFLFLFMITLPIGLPMLVYNILIVYRCFIVKEY